MQKPVEEVIKGLEYLSDADKEKILKARGIDIPEVSPKAQHKIEREETRKAEERDYMNTNGKNGQAQPAQIPASPTMKLHISISSYGRNSDAFTLEGDVYNQDDLAAVHERFKAHMPRKRLWGLL